MQFFIPVPGLNDVSFKLRPVYTGNGVKYFAMVTENYKFRNCFFVEKKNNEWKIINAPRVDEWIRDMEPALNQFLQGIVAMH